jgi:hypothetical protein
MSQPRSINTPVSGYAVVSSELAGSPFTISVYRPLPSNALAKDANPLAKDANGPPTISRSKVGQALNFPASSTA